MEIRMIVDDDLMAELKKSLGSKTNIDVINNALILLNWATKEMKKERVVLSAADNGTDIQTLIMPGLENAKLYWRKAKAKAETT